MNQYEPKTAEDIVRQIEQADELQIDEIVWAVVRRYNALRPAQISTFLTVPANPQDRDAELESIIALIRTCYNLQDS